MDPDPDPGGPKTCRSGFGSATLEKILHFYKIFVEKWYVNWLVVHIAGKDFFFQAYYPYFSKLRVTVLKKVLFNSLSDLNPQQNTVQIRIRL
jgi:hypothetical protein